MCVKSLPFYSVLEDIYFFMVIEFVTSQCYKSHELAQASLLLGSVAPVSDVAHGPLVWFTSCYTVIWCKSLSFVVHPLSWCTSLSFVVHHC